MFLPEGETLWILGHKWAKSIERVLSSSTYLEVARQLKTELSSHANVVKVSECSIIPGFLEHSQVFRITIPTF
jgi:hypothetical protein